MVWNRSDWWKVITGGGSLVSMTINSHIAVRCEIINHYKQQDIHNTTEDTVSGSGSVNSRGDKKKGCLAVKDKLTSISQLCVNFSSDCLVLSLYHPSSFNMTEGGVLIMHKMHLLCIKFRAAVYIMFEYYHQWICIIVYVLVLKVCLLSSHITLLYRLLKQISVFMGFDRWWVGSYLHYELMTDTSPLLRLLWLI